MTSRDGGDAARESSEKGRVHRRGFFAEGLRNILRPIADLVEKRMEAMEVEGWVASDSGSAGLEPGRYGSPPYPSPWDSGGPDSSRTLLRPPGALPEEEFLRRCTSCGECVKACPVSAIRLVSSPDPLQDRKPAIEARVQACVVCDDIACTKVCPSGALQTLSREEIRMGTAVLRRDSCLRSRGEDCQICVDKCPLGARAIEIPHAGAEVVVHAGGCVGCGVCEMYCPTEPRAIVVEPRAPLGSGGAGA
jgi:ferredoxin-type protein NapG